MTRNEMIYTDIESGMPIEEVGYKYGISAVSAREAGKRGKYTMRIKASIDGAEIFDKYPTIIASHIMTIFRHYDISSKEPLVNDLDTYGCFRLRGLGANSLPALEEYTGRKLVYNNYGVFYTIEAMKEKKAKERRKLMLKYKVIKWLSMDKIRPDDGDFILIRCPESESGMMILKYNAHDNNSFNNWMPLPDPPRA